MWAFTTVLAGAHGSRTVEITCTRSPPWVCAHPHPSHQQQPHTSSPPGLPASASPHVQHFLSFLGSHHGSRLHMTFQRTPKAVLPKLFFFWRCISMNWNLVWGHTGCATIHHLPIQRLLYVGKLQVERGYYHVPLLQHILKTKCC